MANYRFWLEQKNKSSSRIPLLLPVLLRQARLKTPITYGDVATEIGIHHRGVDDVAGYIGRTLELIGDTRGWKKRPPPPLQALVVNAITGVPGKGIGGFLSGSWKKAKTNQQKKIVMTAVYEELAAYQYWDDVFALLDIDSTSANLDELTDKARKSAGRGGEGAEHKALKAYIVAHPEQVGLPPQHPNGTPEVRLASGDFVDVVFKHRNRLLAVEVKSHTSGEGDMARGVYQCVKYRAVLNAESSLAKLPFIVSVALVIGKPATNKIKQLAIALKIPLIDNVKTE